MASSPHFPQRTPVNCPSRARSKKWRSVTTGSATAEETHEHGGGVSAEGVGEAGPGTVHLPGPGFPAELGDDLGDLGRARRADRMPLRLEPARRVHRDLAADARPALLRGEAARAGLEEAE